MPCNWGNFSVVQVVPQVEIRLACHSGTVRRAGPGLHEHQPFRGIRSLCSWIPGSRPFGGLRSARAPE